MAIGNRRKDFWSGVIAVTGLGMIFAGLIYKLIEWALYGSPVLAMILGGALLFLGALAWADA